MRNWPASPRSGKPLENWNAPGVEKRKLTVSKKVMTAPMLPTKESFAENEKRAHTDQHGDNNLDRSDEIRNGLQTEDVVKPEAVEEAVAFFGRFERKVHDRSQTRVREKHAREMAPPSPMGDVSLSLAKVGGAWRSN